MLEPLKDLPEGVVGFEAVGEVEASDYRDVLLPAVEEAIAAEEVRLVYLLGERFKGYSLGAGWMDVRMVAGMGEWTAWKRTAVVSDVSWVNNLAAFFGWMIPGQFKQFELDEFHAAVEWAAGRN